MAQTPAPAANRSSRTRHVLINFLAFQAGWFACVVGAAHNEATAGILIAAGVIGLHLRYAVAPRRELKLMGVAFLIGLFCDSAFSASGWIRYVDGSPWSWLAPPWILMLWMVFATTVNVSLLWLRARQWLAALFGAVGAPLAYLSGERLGAVRLDPRAEALAGLAVAWALATPLLLWLGQRWDGMTPDRQSA